VDWSLGWTFFGRGTADMPPVCFFHRVVPDGGQFQRNGVGVAIPCARHCLRARRELLSSIGPWPLVVVRRGRCLLLRGNQRGKRKEGRLLKKSLSLSHCFPEHWLRPRQMRKRCLSSPSVRSFAYSSNGPGLPPPPTHPHTHRHTTHTRIQRNTCHTAMVFFRSNA
jgi:hypothetical protein